MNTKVFLLIQAFLSFILAGIYLSEPSYVGVTIWLFGGIMSMLQRSDIVPLSWPNHKTVVMAIACAAATTCLFMTVMCYAVGLEVMAAKMILLCGIAATYVGVAYCNNPPGAVPESQIKEDDWFAFKPDEEPKWNEAAELHVYCLSGDGEEFYVSSSLEGAIAEIEDQDLVFGEDFLFEDVEQVDDSEVLRCYMEADGLPGKPFEEKTAAEWAKQNGRGHLFGTNY